MMVRNCARPGVDCGLGRSWNGAVKPRVGAPQLRELLRERLTRLVEEARQRPAAGGAIELGMPYGHPVDALGRNWNLAEVSGLNTGCIAPARLLIDSFREAFDLDDA